MSLINQALRKAQRDRTPNRMAPPSENSAMPDQVRTAGNGMNTNLVIGLVAGFASLIGLVVGLMFVVLQKDPAPVPHPAPSVAVTQAPQPATVPAQPLAAPTTPALIPAPAPTAPVATESPSLLEELRIAREAAEAKAAAEAAEARKVEAAALAAKAKAAAGPSKDIIKWLETATISGVRLSESGSKVILNNKSYAVGDIVNFGLGLKVLIIQQQRVLFIDANGKKYLKQL